MSRHEGVTCDVCGKGNFRGKRFKCLICYDFDLCAHCYDNGASSGNHSFEHPMQCILTRADFDLFFGGENLSYERAQSFTCPMCGIMGLSDRRLQEHVVAEHGNSSKEVICPLCAAMPGGDPNMMTDSLVAHLALEHRARQHEYEDTPYRHMRRMYQSSRIPGGPPGNPSSSSSHRSSPFSLRSRAQPQAVFGNGSSLPPGSASSFLSSLVSSGGSGTSSSAGPSSLGGQLVQDSLSQDLVELITQMSHGDSGSGPTPSEARHFHAVPSGSGSQYVFVSPSGAEHLQTAGLVAEQRRLERSNARKYIAGSRGPAHAAASSGGPTSQWECLMGSSAPRGDFVLTGSLSADAGAQPEHSDDDQLERTAFVQELILSMLDMSLTSADLEALSSSSESETEEASAAFEDTH